MYYALMAFVDVSLGKSDEVLVVGVHVGQLDFDQQ